ncbi:hypothetical protein [Rhodococcus qingshengii]|uniref:hypothetical protein n=1 Tax=Rhodococcus qingshengii TaxID=334542 RepID=UPI00237C6725|nr:hypothetical protein [Rhodococcus qingshengii]WCT06028.1 hypothetical protein PI247_29875 [Rhodococcus qingshengii]
MGTIESVGDIESGVDLIRRREVRKFATRNVRHGSGTGTPHYDSVVIAGNGIGALTFAGRLAQDRRFKGQVTVVGPTIPESRKLIQGVNLRGFGADFMAAAAATTHARLVNQFASSELNPACHSQTVGLSEKVHGRWDLVSGPAVWLGGKHGSSAPSAYGFRNSRVTNGLAELVGELSVKLVDEKVTSADHLRSYAQGKNPLLVNATSFPEILGEPRVAPQRAVIAVQAPFTTGTRGLHGMRPRTALATGFIRDGVIDVGYYTPFSDPLSPKSRWYGIVARVVDATTKFDAKRHQAAMTEELLGLADTMGLDVDDLDETLTQSVVPAYPWGRVPHSPPGTLNLSRAYSGGNPAFYADGMTTASVGGYLGAEAVLHGADPDVVVRRALRNVHFYNMLWYCETNVVTPLSRLLIKNIPGPAMLYPHTASRRVWYSAA